MDIDNTSLSVSASSPLSVDSNGLLSVDISNPLSDGTSPSFGFLLSFLTNTQSCIPYSAFTCFLLLFLVAGFLPSLFIIALQLEMKVELEKWL